MTYLLIFSKLTNGLISLGEPISNDHKVQKMIWWLLKSWEVVANTLKELNDSMEMNFTVFMGNLMTHEM